MSGYWKRVVARYLDGHVGAPIPQFYGAGNWYDTSSLFMGGTSNFGFPVARLTWLAPFNVPVNSAFLDVGVVVSTVVAGCVASVGLYRPAYTNILGVDAVSLVRPLGQISLATLNFQTVGLPSPVEIEQGFYYLAIEVDRITPVIAGLTHGVAANARFASYGYADPATSISLCQNGLNADNTSVAFGDWTQLLPVFPTSGGFPRIFLQYLELSGGAP